MLLQLQSLVGLTAIPLFAWAISENRSAFRLGKLARLIAAGIGLQFAIAGLLLGVPQLKAVFDYPTRVVEGLQQATNAGMRLVFGYLAGGPAPYEAIHPEASFILALHALPLILIVSVLTKLLYHWGVLQRVVAAFAAVLESTLGVSGPVGTSAAANVFVGMVEAPLVVRPYLAAMTRGELFATMSVGMAGIAGTVLALYATLLEPQVPGATGHLIIASFISVPAALMLSLLMVPDDGVRPIEAEIGTVTASAPELGEAAPHSTMDAITQGTREGVDLLVNVTAMLIVAVALVAIANQLLGWVTTPFGVRLTLEGLLGTALAPLAWVIGIPWTECAAAGALIGVKTVLNEFVAYLQLAALPAEAMSPRSRLLLTYALCGFANFGSLGIMIGGLVAMAPTRRVDIVGLGMKTIVSGTLATMMTGAVIGLLSAP
jgi:CNT family concentrative nucleoside transporter